MDTTLTQIVDTLREQARDLIRMKEINSLKTFILEEKNKISESEKYLESQRKQLLYAKFALVKLDQADPDYSSEKVRLEQLIASDEKRINRLEITSQWNVEDINVCITKLESDIKKWESGEKKVSKELLEETTKKLISEYKPN
jgi:hypothetical protein